MIETITPDNYADVLKRTDGYLVHVTRNERAVAHILAHKDGNCFVQMGPVQEYPKLYATTFLEALVEAHTRWNVPCSLCVHCKSAIVPGSIGQLCGQRTAGRFTITFDVNSWDTLLVMLGWAGASAEVENEPEMERGVRELLAALLVAGDTPALLGGIPVPQEELSYEPW